MLLPPYGPEPNPAERVLEELRRRLEGRTYPTVTDKQAVAVDYLTTLTADLARVQRLCGWTWIRASLHALPTAMSTIDRYQMAPTMGAIIIA